MRTFKLLLALLLLTTQLSAIDINRKLGKISKEELQMTVYDKDASAEAVVLFDIGNTSFTFLADKGFTMIYDRKVRIKILNKDGLDYADFSIELYSYLGNDEKLSRLKATTYNLEKGKIVKTKLNKKDIYEVEDTKNKNLTKFSLPAVREGSVIEVSYTIQSDYYYNLQNWNFQHFIPTLWSEYTVEIPEYFRYNKIAKGYLSFDINESSNEQDYFTFVSKNNTGVNRVSNTQATKSNINSERINFVKQVSHFVVKDALALKKEAYMLSADNYLSSVEFELSQIKFPNSALKNYSNSWESINKDLLQYEHFGAYLKNSNYLSKIVEEVKAKTDDQKEQIFLLQRYVVNNYKWDGKNSMYATKLPRTTYIEKIGNSADLNFLMLLLLKEAGFSVDPVILSTRNNGLLNLVYPSKTQTNYVVTLLRLENQNILIDATNSYCLPGMLPPKCINDKGRIISAQNSGWVNIEPSVKNNLTVTGDFEITEQDINGRVLKEHMGYAAYNLRYKFKGFNNEQDYITDVESNNPGIKINESKFENIDSIRKPIKEEYTNISIQSIENMGNILYFNPITIDKIEENPFKLEKRGYPINYSYLYNHKYVFNYTIPEGYIVEEMPKSEEIELPENSAKFIYKITAEGNKIQVTVQFNINKRQFLPQEYNYMKEFYNKIIAKESEQIVLKKS